MSGTFESFVPQQIPFDVVVVCAMRRCAKYAHGMSELCEKHGKKIRDVSIKQLKNGRYTIGNMRTFVEKNCGLVWMLCTPFLENWDCSRILRKIHCMDRTATHMEGSFVKNFTKLISEDKIFSTILILLSTKHFYLSKLSYEFAEHFSELHKFFEKNRLHNVFLVRKNENIFRLPN